MTRHAAKWLTEIAMQHENDACLIWPFATLKSGYGIIRKNKKTYTVSNLLCEMVRGLPPSADHEAAHSCNNRGCVNKRHLSWKTKSANRQDKYLHGTMPVGEKSHLAKLTDQQVREIISLRGIMFSGRYRKDIWSIEEPSCSYSN